MHGNTLQCIVFVLGFPLCFMIGLDSLDDVACFPLCMRLVFFWYCYIFLYMCTKKRKKKGMHCTMHGNEKCNKLRCYWIKCLPIIFLH